MKQRLLFFTLLLMSGFLTAQTTILDFESDSTSTTFQYFGSTLEGQLNALIANPDPSGINTSDTVAELIKPAGAQTWAGAFSNPDPATQIDLTGGNEIYIKVWTSSPGNLALKFENGTQANWINTVQINDTMQWVELTFDSEQNSEEDPFTPASGGIYDRVVVFFDFGESPTADRTYYFDDLRVEEVILEPVDITFSVDMNEYPDSFGNVFVSGTFNGWSGNANMLDDSDGDGVWSGTVTGILPGSHEYKFQVDEWNNQEFFGGFEPCTVVDPSGQFVNRSLVASADDTLATVCFGSCFACGQGVQITFNVGQGGITLSPDGLFVAGGGNFGIPGDFPLSDDDMDGVHSITLERQVGFSSFYTFANGACGDFSCKENIAGQSCANPENFNDRFLPPVMSDTTINTCFGLCTDTTDCGTQNAMVTFTVDMTNYADSFGTVFLSGNFNGWSGNGNPLTDNGDGTWSTTIELVAGDYEYKFQLDEWTVQEQFTDGDPCTITDPSGQFINRALTVGGEDQDVCYFWNTCDMCETASPMVSFTVDMSDYSDPFTTVFLSGNFNEWSGNANPMTDNGDGTWSTALELAAGDYEYKFQVDEWAASEQFTDGDPCTITDPSGQFVNRLINVATGDEEVCFPWESCDPCGGATPMVHFTVDMSDYSDPFTTVFLSGNFNEWSGNANPMTDNGDGTWSTALELAAGDYEYKFQVDEWAASEQFSDGDPCTITDPSGQFVNRLITVTTGEEEVCFPWESCDPCAGETPMVSFTVDMSDYADPFTTVFLSGNFNEWSGNANPMTDNGDGTWSTELELAPGDYEYKFQVDEWAASEQFADGDPCTITDPSGQFVNRLITVTTGEEEVCFPWESCDPCGGAAPMVSFTVDMSDYTDPFTTVFLSGNFNEWSGNANPMTDNGDGTWSTELELAPGDYEYKFQVDEWAASEQFADGDPCTITDPSGQFVNRLITVTTGDEEVCFPWESCDECVTSSVRDLETDQRIFSLQPTITSDAVTVLFNTDFNNDKQLTILNSFGQLIATQQLSGNISEHMLDVSNLAGGMYLVNVRTERKQLTRKIIVSR